MKKLKLSLELIPEQNWGLSLANKLPKPVWNWFRKKVYLKFHYVCAICGSPGEMHCHEVWEWNQKRKWQILKGAQCLCRDCHHIKHWGRTIAEFHKGTLTADYIKKLTQHFCTVNNCTEVEFEVHKLEARELWASRSKIAYKINWGSWSPVELEKKYRQEMEGKKVTL